MDDGKTFQIHTKYHIIYANEKYKSYYVTVNDNVSGLPDSYCYGNSNDPELKTKLHDLTNQGYKTVYITCECGCTKLKETKDDELLTLTD